MRWSSTRARRVLGEAAQALAAGEGQSDRALVRLAAVTHPEDVARAITSAAAFRGALRRAGWRPSRIDRAVAEVRYGTIGARIFHGVCTVGRRVWNVLTSDVRYLLLAQAIAAGLCVTVPFLHPLVPSILFLMVVVALLARRSR